MPNPVSMSCALASLLLATGARAVPWDDCTLDDDGRPSHGLHVHVHPGSGCASGNVSDLEAHTTTLNADGTPTYANYRLVLTPGLYKLCNEITLQPGQSIYGQQQYIDRDGDGVWDPVNPGDDPADLVPFVAAAPTVIQLPQLTCLPNSCVFAADDSGIRMQNGNSIEGVTVLGTGWSNEILNNRHLISCDYSNTPAPLPCRIANNVLANAGGAIEIAVNRRTIPIPVPGNTAEISGNVIQAPASGIEWGFGFGEQGLTSTGILIHNRIAGAGELGGGGHGLVVANTNSTNCTINVTSIGNIIDRSTKQGILILGGLDFGGPSGGPVTGDLVEWNSFYDRIWRNALGFGNDCSSPSPTNCGAAGLAAVALIATLDFNTFTSSYNHITFNLVGTRFIDDSALLHFQNGGLNRLDLVAFEPFVPPPGSPLATDTVSVSAVGVSSDNTRCGPSTFAVQEDPSLTQIMPASQAAFDSANHGFNWPFESCP